MMFILEMTVFIVLFWTATFVIDFTVALVSGWDEHCKDMKAREKAKPSVDEQS